MASILVVDDSATHRRVAGSLLEKRIGATGARMIEWRVSYACHGQEALDAIARDPPDLVLTDLLMPGIDGLQLLEQIKQVHPSLPVILMTGYDSEAIAMEALARGAVCYVPKHKLPKELVDTADNILAMAENPHHAQPRLEERAPQPSAGPSPAPPRPSRPQPLDECWIHTETYYRLPNDTGCLTALLARLQDNLRRLQLCDGNGILRVAVALREALSNAIVHGNLEISAHVREADPEGYRALLQERQGQEPYARRSVHLFVRETWDEVRYRIRDEGPGFDPTTAEAANPANLNQDTGRGLRMIKTFMDEVRHNDQGNEITLVKRRAGN
jgi:CheY-like chemotaxis protein